MRRTRTATLLPRLISAASGREGLPELRASKRATPLIHSLCQYVVATREPLVVNDARTNPVLCTNLAIRDLKVVAYCGIPLMTANGEILGSFCAMDDKPHDWKPEEIGALKALARIATDELNRRTGANR